MGLGAEYIHEDGEIDSVIDFGFPVSADFSRKRETWALFGETAVDICRNLSLVASLRHDDAENIDATNVRVAANLDIEASNTSLSISYGEGFKLPSLFALGHALTGNSNLVPERSESIALDIRQSLESLNSQLSFRLYHNEFKNLVDFDFTIFSHVNRTSATTEGFDLGVNSRITSKLNLGANVSYLHTDVSNGTRLERRPEWKGNFIMSWRPKENR